MSLSLFCSKSAFFVCVNSVICLKSAIISLFYISHLSKIVFSIGFYDNIILTENCRQVEIVALKERGMRVFLLFELINVLKLPIFQSSS